MGGLEVTPVFDSYRSPGAGAMRISDFLSGPLCGDEVRIQARVDGEGRLAEAYFKGQGCVISLASASMLMEAVEGKSLQEIKDMGRQDVLDMLGISLTTMRVKCAMLPLRTLEKAILLYEGR